MATTTAPRLRELPLADRRTKARFPIELGVSYRSSGKSRRTSGIGRTLNISSAGVLVAADHRVRLGDSLKVALDWPWLLDQVTRLQLIATGRVVRADVAAFAIAMERYQFRTAGRRSVTDEPALTAQWRLRA